MLDTVVEAVEDYMNAHGGKPEYVMLTEANKQQLFQDLAGLKYPDKDLAGAFLAGIDIRSFEGEELDV